MRTLDDLIAAIRAEALRAPFPVDEPVYARAGKDPATPVLYAGNLDAPVCVFGRDLGKDEVAHGEPLIGAGGSLVRRGLIDAFAGGPAPASDRWLRLALDHATLTNTVPYKPPGNKAYPEGVKKRFRPFVAEFVAGHWRGSRILTLGTEAFQWFAPYAEPGAADALWARGDDRYGLDLPVRIAVETPDGPVVKEAVVSPLPHPSPLNQRWFAAFPDLLAARLAGLGRNP